MENTLSKLDSYKVLGQDEMMDCTGGGWLVGKMITLTGFVYAAGNAVGVFINNVWHAFRR